MRPSNLPEFKTFNNVYVTHDDTDPFPFPSNDVPTQSQDTEQEQETKQQTQELNDMSDNMSQSPFNNESFFN